MSVLHQMIWLKSSPSVIIGFVTPPQYTVHTKRVPFDSDNEVSPYSLSPLSNKRYDTSWVLAAEHETVLRFYHWLTFSSQCFICSHKLLRSPRKPARKISKIPFKVLDAPELQDDFYLNLVDWSAGNLLSVGLGACVYLWSACTSQVWWSYLVMVGGVNIMCVWSAEEKSGNRLLFVFV